jgi:basic membrane protein A
VSLVVVGLALLAGGCGSDEGEAAPAATTAAPAATTAAPAATTAAPAATTAAPAATTAAPAPAEEAPTSLSIASIHLQILDDPWNSTIIDAIERAKVAKPHGLEITRESFENIEYADGERVLRGLAESGKYDMIIGHSTFGDAVAALMGEFPDIAWVYSGSGNEALGGNAFWIDVMLHEPGYVAGVVAGLMSETNMIGGVAAFPYPNVAGPMNAFFDGARSVNPDIETSVTYIQSWFDPAAAREAGGALIAAGADSLYAASAFGTFEAIGEGDRVFAVGDFANLEAFYPDVMITSLLALWDPGINDVIDAWWDYAANGVPYDAPMERILYSMADGGSDIAPMNEALVPADVAAAAADVRNQILSGEFVVELNTSPTGDEEEAVAASDGPESLEIGMIVTGVKEEGWYSSMLDSIARASEAKPHGLDISVQVFEKIPYAEGERVLRDLAQSGEFDMIILHSTYSDAVAAVMDEFPETMFVYSGSGNEALGRNGYWIDVHIHESSYLAGVIAGMMTETNVLGGVAAFPYPNVSAPLNAWIAGAQSVNPAVTAYVTYIESWFDPTTAKAAADAQVANGADMLYAERLGPFESALEHEGVYAFGHFTDQMVMAPDVVLASPVALWDPSFNYAVDAWWAHAAEGASYDAPMERVIYFMPEGGNMLSPMNDLVPADVQAAVGDARDRIMSGELVVEFNPAPVEQTAGN